MDEFRTAAADEASLAVISGLVEQGDRRGRVLGFPTANVAIAGKSLRAFEDGVWWGRTTSVLGRHTAVISIGHRATFYGRHGERLVEVHLLDVEAFDGVDGALHGTRLETGLMGFLRRQRRFAAVEELVDQLHRDVAEARALAATAPGEQTWVAS